MTVEELEEQIIQLPEQYEKALRMQTETIVEVRKLEFELEKLQKNLTKEENDNDSSEETDEELIKLDTNLEKLKLKLSESESNVELEARLSNGKVTESHVKSLVTIDQKVSQLRNELIEAKAKIKIRKAEVQRKRSELWEKRRQRRNDIENDELIELKNKLNLAKGQNFFANDEVETLKFKLDTFRLLVAVSE